MVNRLVLLVHSFPLENSPRFSIPFKLLFDVDMANFEVKITIDDVLFNDTNMETQILCPNGFPWCGLKEKAYIFLCTLIQSCCISSDFVVDLTIGTCIIQFNLQYLPRLCCFVCVVMLKFMIFHSCMISKHFH
jgi:hypothetical protein